MTTPVDAASASESKESKESPPVLTGSLSFNEEEWKDKDFLSLGEPTATTAASPAPDPKRPVIIAGEIPVVSMFTKELPPWLHDYPDSGKTPPLVRLHNEIVGFARLMMPREDEIKQREDLIVNFRGVALKAFGKDNCKVVLFGSQATGLFLPESDIDIVIQLPKSEDNKSHDTPEESKEDLEKKEMDEWDLPVGSPLFRLADALKETWKDDLTYLEVVENTRVPIVKFTHGPTNISIDVCIDQGGGPESADTMNTFLDNFPPLRPLCFVLKYFMKIRAINEPYHGGVGSFMLQMMIVSFLQHRARENYKNDKSLGMNLGSLLLEFFELYGLDFNYITTGISVRNNGSYFPKGSKERRDNFWQPLRSFSLAVENPNDPKSDVGRSSYRMTTIQRAFDVAFRIVLAHVSEPIVPAVSILAAILPPTYELHRRAAMRKVLGLDSKPNLEREEKTAMSRGGSQGEEDIPKWARTDGDADNPKRSKKKLRKNKRQNSNMDSSSEEDIPQWARRDSASSNDRGYAKRKPQEENRKRRKFR